MTKTATTNPPRSLRVYGPMRTTLGHCPVCGSDDVAFTPRCEPTQDDCFTCHPEMWHGKIPTYAYSVAADATPTPEPHGQGGQGHGRQSGPTTKQIAFADKLIDEGWADKADALKAKFRALASVAAASEAIDRMLAKLAERRQGKVEVVAAVKVGVDLRQVPEGHYAVPNGDTRLKVQVDRPTEGKWAGWIFVSDGAEYGQRARYGSQKPGAEFYQGKIEDALAAIAADPAAASMAYGHLVGRCGVCNRHLEDEQSVARGIGPICARKMGW